MFRESRFYRWTRLLGVVGIAAVLVLCGLWLVAGAPSRVAGEVQRPENRTLSWPSPLSLTIATHLPLVTKADGPVDWTYKGASLAGYWHDAYESPNAYANVDYMHRAGANSIAVVTSWYQQSSTSTAIRPNPKRTPTDSSLEAVIDYIHAHPRSMSVLLKPHLEVLEKQNGKDVWRAKIDPSNRSDWFDSYTEFMVHYARMAERHKVELLCIGTEMVSMTDTPEERIRWGQVISAVRGVYSGTIIYSAFQDEALGSPEIKALPSEFWQDLDYAAMTFYYPLSISSTLAPSVDELYESWQGYEKKLNDWQAQHQKPVLFGEIGYRSVDSCAYQPWASGWDCQPDQYNEQCQANAYRAAFRYLSAKEWLHGVYWWQFEPRGPTDNLGACQCTDYTPACKPAGGALAVGYAGSVPDKQCRPVCMPSLPLIDDFEYANRARAQDVWQAQGTGPIKLAMDPKTRPDKTDSTRSMKITTYLTCTEPITARYMQLRYPFCVTQTWSSYDYLTVQVKVDKSNCPHQGGEFSIVLVDLGDKEPEYWQATRWMERQSDWVSIRIPLQGHGKGNPFEQQNQFVIPEWEWKNARNEVLDLGHIKEVWIKASSGISQCHPKDHPGFAVWVDEMRLKQK